MGRKGKAAKGISKAKKKRAENSFWLRRATDWQGAYIHRKQWRHQVVFPFFSNSGQMPPESKSYNGFG
jgi:hypothetical protein